MNYRIPVGTMVWRTCSAHAKATDSQLKVPNPMAYDWDRLSTRKEVIYDEGDRVIQKELGWYFVFMLPQNTGFKWVYLAVEQENVICTPDERDDAIKALGLGMTP